MFAAAAPHTTRFSQPLAISFVLSLLVHVLVGLALLTAWKAQSASAPQRDRTPIHDPQKPDPIRAGILNSNAVTINWLGFETPTPHQATQSSTDQAALSPMPAGQVVAQKPAAAAVRKPASSTPTPTSTPTTTPTSASTQASLAAAKASLLAARGKLAKIFATTQATARAMAKLAPKSPADTTTKSPTKNPTKNPTKKPAKKPTKRPAPVVADAQSATNPSPASSPAPATRVGTDTPGEKSHKESPATSRQKPIEWHPGHPAAAQGLDIVTVSPHWSYTTRLSALPRNPLVRIEFARDGHVKKAMFLPKQSTGYPDVDGPLLDAIYRWKGKGKALDDLPDQPDAAVSITFRIILNASRGKIQKPKTSSK